MWKPFICRYGIGARSVVQDYPGPADPAATPVRPGDWVVVAAGVIAVVAGVDPATLLGIAKGGNQIGEGAIQDETILVEVFTHDSLVAMPGTTAPAAANVGVSYGILYDAAQERWKVDTAETVNTRVKVIDIDENRGWFIVRVLEANRQEG
jgi:hypothetical protein